MALQAFGVIGLEVMGRNIALNIERNGFPIAVFNRTYAKTQAFLGGVAKGKNAKGAERIEDFVKLLERSPHPDDGQGPAPRPTRRSGRSCRSSSRATSSSTAATRSTPTPSGGPPSWRRPA